MVKIPYDGDRSKNARKGNGCCGLFLWLLLGILFSGMMGCREEDIHKQSCEPSMTGHDLESVKSPTELP